MPMLVIALEKFQLFCPPSPCWYTPNPSLFMLVFQLMPQFVGVTFYQQECVGAEFRPSLNVHITHRKQMQISCCFFTPWLCDEKKEAVLYFSEMKYNTGLILLHEVFCVILWWCHGYLWKQSHSCVVWLIWKMLTWRHPRWNYSIVILWTDKNIKVSQM